MKRKISLLLTGLFSCLLTVSIYAQRNGQRDGQRMNMADFEKRKMAYIQKEAGLTQEECDRYFPINNELSRKKFELHRQHRQKIQKMKRDNGNMSDEEYRALLNNDMDVKLKEAELDKLYSGRFEKTLSPEKLYKAQQAEKKFMQEEVAKFREGRGERKNKDESSR